MRKQLLLVLLLAGSGVRAGNPDVLLLHADADTPTAQRVEQHVEKNLALPVRRQAAEMPAFEWPADSAGQLTVPEDEQARLFIWLLTPEAGGQSFYNLDAERGVAAVNLTALQAGEPDEETYGRRVERAVLQVIGKLIGVGDVPIPRSVMYPFTNLKELDRTGRNFDPPTLLRAQQLAKEAGFTLLEDSPFNILDVPTRPARPAE